MTRKTKIVATIGPSTEHVDMLVRLIRAGLNVARVNFSHGNHEEHGKKIRAIKEASNREGKPIAILQDLAGPKIRIGDFETQTVELKKGDLVVLTTKKITCTPSRLHVNYPKFAAEVSSGQIVFLDDGKLRLVIKSVKGSEVRCSVSVGGTIRSRRGVSVPEARFTIKALTEKDKKDALFCTKEGVDFVALSFVQDANDVNDLRRLLTRAGSKARIIAKIETRSAVANIESIIKEADGIMVARGDLAVEISPEEVPIAQKQIINLCNKAGKPVITATQMLESMIRSATPTRAEVSDIANAVLDGTDAIMLSEETALGPYPVEAIEVMNRVALRVEGDFLHKKLLKGKHRTDGIHDITDSITAGAIDAAESMQARFIVALTMSGFSARMLSRHKAPQEIIAMTPSEGVCRQLALSFACRPVHITPPKTFDGVIKMVRSYLLTHKLGKKGEKVIVASGIPFGHSIETNALLIEEL